MEKLFWNQFYNNEHEAMIHKTMMTNDKQVTNFLYENKINGYNFSSSRH